MDATPILLAAGRGERLRPLTDAVPKPAIPILDVPVGAFGLAALGPLGPVIVNVRHPSEEVTTALGPYAPAGVDFVVERPEPYGTAGTLWALADRIPDRAVTHNADVIGDIDVLALLATHARMGAPVTLAVREVRAGADFRGSGGRATELVDRRTADAPGWLYLGIGVFERAAIELIGQPRPMGITEAVLRPSIARREVALHVHAGYFADVGTPASYLAASLDALDGRGPTLPGPRRGRVVEVEGGRAYVGDDTQVTDESLEPGAIVLAGAQVEEGARVTRSIVWPNEIVPAGAELVDSIWAFGRAFPIRRSTRVQREKEVRTEDFTRSAASCYEDR